MQVSRSATSTLDEVRMEGDPDWEVIGLEKLLQYLCDMAAEFKTLLLSVLRGHNRLRLILYADGITPGSGFAHDNKRKSTIWYISFLEFGRLLCYEECWFTLASARTSFCKAAPAGISGLTRRLLRDLFVVQRVSDNGVTVHGVTAYVDFHALLGDEEALNAMLYTKGASGLVPCAALCCVVNKPIASDTELGLPSLAERSPLIVDISCSDIRRIGRKTDADVWKLCDDVAALGGGAQKRKEKSSGFGYHAEALLYDHVLRMYFKPASQTRVDPMHIVFSNGVMSSEVMLLLGCIKERHRGYYFKELREYLEPWKTPGHARVATLSDLVNEHRERASNDMLKVGGACAFAAVSTAAFSLIDLCIFSGVDRLPLHVAHISKRMSL